MYPPLAATSTMWDTLGGGGETQVLIYNPNTGEVKGINALGVAPTGATVEYFREQGMSYPPEYGPLAAVTPGTPGGLDASSSAAAGTMNAATANPAITPVNFIRTSFACLPRGVGVVETGPVTGDYTPNVPGRKRLNQ